MDQPDLRGEILIFLRLYGFFRLVSVSIGAWVLPLLMETTHMGQAKEVQDAYMVIGDPLPFLFTQNVV